MPGFLTHQSAAAVENCASGERDIGQRVPDESEELDNEAEDDETNLQTMLTRFCELIPGVEEIRIAEG